MGPIVDVVQKGESLYSYFFFDFLIYALTTSYSLCICGLIRKFVSSHIGWKVGTQ